MGFVLLSFFILLLFSESAMCSPKLVILEGNSATFLADGEAPLTAHKRSGTSIQRNRWANLMVIPLDRVPIHRFCLVSLTGRFCYYRI